MKHYENLLAMGCFSREQLIEPWNLSEFMDLVQHYCRTFRAEHIGILHEYQIFIDEKPAQELVEVYDYEWTDEEV